MVAARIKKEFENISPFIQKHTSFICPSCEKVCCIDRHGHHDKDDACFLAALGVTIPEHGADICDTEPCRFLSLKGCSLERWMRPFRCTWYFCEQLLESMREDNSKAYREFVTSLQRLVLLRQKFTDR